MDPIGIIILAAGASTRMGSSKQLICIDDIPLLRKTTQAAIDAHTGNIVVVLGAKADQHRVAIHDLPIEIYVHAEWENGMGSSLKAGLQHLCSKGTVSAVMITVCDQPAVTSHHLAALHREHLSYPNSIVASQYENVMGVPALFPSTYFPNLKALPDEGGARQIIAQNLLQTRAIVLPHGEIDLDQPEDIERWKKRK